MTTRIRLVALLITCVLTGLAAPSRAAGNGNGHDSGPFRDGCAVMTLDAITVVDPMVQYWEGTIDNACRPDVRLQGVLELWVDGRLEDAQPVVDGRARVQRLRGGVLPQGILPQSCVIFRGEQIQLCDHRNNDAPGHVMHADRYPIEADRCGARVTAR